MKRQSAIAAFIRRNWAPLLLVLVAVVFFFRVLTLKETYAFGDTRTYYYPARVFMSSALRSGHMPFWCRYISSGFPLFADSEPALFYLPNLIGSFLPNLFAFNYSIFLHYLAIALFTYLYARSIDLSKVASFFCGLTFTFMGFSIIRLGHLNILMSLAWFTLSLYLIEKGVKKGSLAYFVLAGLALAMQFLAGYMMMGLFTSLIAVFYVLLYPRPERWTVRGLLQAIGMLAVLGIIGIGVSAIQNLPSYALVGVSTRAGGVSSEFASRFNMPISGLATLVFPKFFGGATTYHWYWDFGTIYAYMGIVPLVLAPFALLRRVRWHARFYLGAGLLALIVSFGNKAFLWTAIRRIPGFNVLKDPSRFMLIVDFSLVVLAAIGLDRLLARDELGARRISRVLKVLACVAVFVIGGLAVIKVALDHNLGGLFTSASRHSLLPGIISEHISFASPNIYVPVILVVAALGLLWLWRRGVFSRTLFASLLIAFVLFEVFFSSYNINPVTPSSAAYRESPLTRSIERDKGIYRATLSRDPTVSPAGSRYQPNTLMTFGIEDARGYTSVPSKRNFDFMYAVAGLNKAGGLAGFGLLNVRYFISDLELIAGRMFDTSRPVSFNCVTPPAKWVVGGFDASRLEMLSVVQSGPPMPKGWPVGRVWIRSDGHPMGPYQIRIGEETDQVEYRQFVSQGKLDRGCATPVTYWPRAPLSEPERLRYLGTIDLGGTVRVEEISIVMAPDNAARSFTVTAMNLVGEESRPVLTGPVIYMDKYRAVCRNPAELPRVFTVGGVKICPDYRKAVEAISERSLDPGRTVALERDTLDGETAARLENWGPDRRVEGRAEVVLEDGNSEVIEAEAPEECILFRSESYMPGWEATIDGKKTNIYPAFGALTALYMPRGKHRFELRYHAPGLLAGAVVSFATLLLALFCLLGLFFLGRKKKPDARAGEGAASSGPPAEEGSAEAAEDDPLSRGISVFFPTCNDEGTIEGLVTGVISVIEKYTTDLEVTVVDDGSGDRTGEIADRLAESDTRIRAIHHEKNRGYGGALKSGLLASRKGLVFYTDGDGQYDVRDLELLLEKRFDADVVNGYKTERGDPWYREIIGHIYNIFVRYLFGIQISDVDCDFRLMRKEALEGLELMSDGGSICLEMIKKIQDRGFTFAEVPVRHLPRTSGKSEFFKLRHLFRMTRELSILWWELEFKKHVMGNRAKTV